MNIVTIIRKAGRRFGDSNNIVVNETDWLDFINDAQLDITRRTGAIVAETTPAAASTYPIDFPSTMIRIKRVIYNGYTLPKIAIEDINDFDSYEAAVGVPAYFYINENKIHLYPDADTTDSNLTSVEYISTPTTITATSDSLTVPTSFHEDIVTFCVMRAHEVNQNYKAQEIAFNEYERSFGMRLEDINVVDDTYPSIRSDPWDSAYYDPSLF